MLLIICVSLLAASTLGQLDRASMDAQWDQWKITYNKTYSEPKEEQVRKAIWEKHLKMIIHHNKRAAQGMHSYEMAMNMLGDMTPEEVAKTMTGLQAPQIHWRSFTAALNYSETNLPKCIDYRKKGMVTSVKNQGSCGSCWAFSAAGALEGQLAKMTGRLVDLSPQNLVDCATENYGCRGGYMTTSFKYVMENGGIDSEKAYPYVGKDNPCRYNVSGSAAQCKGFMEIPHGDEHALAVAVYKVGPISVGINARQSSFMFYQKGVYFDPNCNNGLINHAVLVVGYGVTPKGKKYWIIKNSWGKSWGKNGYILMGRNRRNLCWIASLASYPIM